MNVTPARRWLHRFAWLTATLTLLLPVATGAVVTTLKAGMAFPDWPSSDGYNMLAYPWLGAARDQFVEHGHRLSGLTIGVLSIALAVAACFIETRRWVRMIALGIFGSVFVQGMLGGARVLMDKDTMALVHGDFAAAVFCLMCLFVVVTSPRWETRPRSAGVPHGRLARQVSMAILLAVAIQYFLGSVLRHLQESWAWLLHPWFALAPVLLILGYAVLSRSTDSPLLVRSANSLLALVVVQALLGLASWYVRYGVPAWGVVAELNSPSQVIVCSLHKIVGMLTLMASFLNVVGVNLVQPRTADRLTAPAASGSMVGAAT